MTIDAALVASLAREFLGLAPGAEAELAKTARRLDSLLKELERERPGLNPGLAPAFAFDPTLYRQPNEAVVKPAATPQPPPGGEDFLAWPVAALARAVTDRALSPVEVTRACLDRIAAGDGAVRAFVTVLAEEALAQAKALEGRRSGALLGVPVAVKDIYSVKGVRTTAGSRLLADHVSAEDAALVTRLRQAGAVIIGKTATHEFAYGVTTDSPFHGPVYNPIAPDRTPGGSSGGSGAAVAAAMLPAAMGTDTAGSIRIPAACCGVVGLKPTYGRLSKEGILPLSWSLDHPGPLVRTVADAGLLLEGLDSSFQAPGRPADLKGLRIGLPVAWLALPMSAEVRAAFEHGIDLLAGQGAELVEVELPSLDLLHFVSRILTLAEAGAYHSQYLDRLDQYGPDLRSRVELGQYVLARDYLLAQRLRTALCEQMAGVMGGVDALATPTMPIAAPLAGQRHVTFPDGRQEAAADAMMRYVAPFNVTGQPAISLPCGSGSLSSIQLVGRFHGEALLLQIAAALEAALGGGGGE